MNAKPMTWKLVGLLSLTLFSGACSSQQDPKTPEDLEKFCNAPDYVEKLKAMDEARRRKISSACLRRGKFVPSPGKGY